MASYTGYTAESVLVLSTQEFLSSSIWNGVPSDISVLDIYDSSASLQGAKTSNLPVSMPEADHIGYLGITFLDDYYYRIHIVPVIFELGPILTNLERDFIVWNSYFVSKTCSAINEVGVSGLTLIGLTAPFVLDGLAHSDYTIEIPLEGNPLLDAVYSFDFGVDDIIDVIITGTRVTLFIFRPQESVNESLGWLTDILEPSVGISAEQRISLRRTPRQQFNFSIMVEDEQAQSRFDALIFNAQRRIWGLPVWTEMVVHTANITAGALTIDIDTTNADFRANSLAVIWKSLIESEVVEIASLTTSQLVLNSPVINNYTGTKLIIPIRLAKMNSIVQASNYSTGLAVFNSSFAVIDNLLLAGYTPTLAYKSLPVLISATPVDMTQDKSSDAQFYESNFGVGDFDLLMDKSHNKRSLSYLFLNDTKAECWTFRKFLHSLYGQQKCFWVPTFKPDLNLLETISPSDTSFNISNISLAKNMGLNSVRTHLAFIFPSGTIICKEILGITYSSETEEIISIDSGLGVEVAPGSCIISFLDKCRLASDSVELSWPMAGQNESFLNLTAVKE